MVKPAHGKPDPIAADASSLLARREALLRELNQVESELAKHLTVAQQRELAAKPLRGAITYHGDIVEPTGELWEAEQ